jgi:hypothetical protein
VLTQRVIRTTNIVLKVSVFIRTYLLRTDIVSMQPRKTANKRPRWPEAQGILMTNALNSLALDALVGQARGAARADEQRLGAGTSHVQPDYRSEETLQGWGDAALLRLEWRSHRSYPPAERLEYRYAYAAAFQQARAARAAQWVAASQRL